MRKEIQEIDAVADKPIKAKDSKNSKEEVIGVDLILECLRNKRGKLFAVTIDKSLLKNINTQ